MRARAIKLPPWLLFPVGFGLARFGAYRGDLRWLMGLSGVLLDVAILYALLRLAQRYPLGRRQPLRHLGPYAAAAFVFLGASIGLQRAIIANDPRAEAAIYTFPHLILGELLTFLIWAGLAHTVIYLRRYRAIEADSLRLRLDLANVARTRAEAELRSFEADVNPRFLIGALRSAADHAQSDPARGERLLVEIGDVMRAARPASRVTTLGDEIAALAPFVTLEQERLNQDVALRSSVPDELLDAPLPPLVLAALVQEALRTTSDTGAIAIDITASRADDVGGEQLQVVVSSRLQRPAFSNGAAEDGVLARTADHLRDAFGGRGTIDVARSESGARVRLTVPMERDEPETDTAPASEDDFPTAPHQTRSRRAVPLVLALWFVTLSALNFNTAVTRPQSNGLLAPPGLAVIEALLAAGCFTLMLYVAIRLTRRGFGPRMFGLHAGAGVGLGLFNAVLKWLFIALAGHPYPPHTLRDFVGRAFAGLTAYGLLAGIIGAVEYARRYRSAEEKGLRLQAELAEAERGRVEAELRALKAELNPHFLGNALTGALSLMHTNPAAARDVLTKLADVVGSVVTRVGTQEVTLQEEMDSLAPFIAVEQSRFGDRLSVQWNVAADARTARVPHLILQPLLENAVKHGLAAPNGGRIVVGGRRAGERLELTVQDDGVGLEQAKKGKHARRGGVGLSNSRARLEQLYGSEATLQLEPAPETGTIVRVTLPWR